jgi:DNA-binding LytR/AlgR family response regulator
MDLTIAICDDEQRQIEYLKQLVTKWSSRCNLKIHFKQYISAEQFLFDWEQDKSSDILLLDIQMGGLDGVELAKKLRLEEDLLQIVFVTGFSDFMAQGYDVAALHYLIKPVDSDKLFPVLDRAVKNLQQHKKSVLFSSGADTLKLYIADICYVEAFVHSVEIHTQKTSYTIKMGISQVEKLLQQASFFRSHRSYLVNLRWIKCISKKAIVLDTNQEIPLSRRLYNEANQAFIQYFKGED